MTWQDVRGHYVDPDPWEDVGCRHGVVEGWCVDCLGPRREPEPPSPEAAAAIDSVLRGADATKPIQPQREDN